MAAAHVPRALVPLLAACGLAGAASAAPTPERTLWATPREGLELEVLAQTDSAGKWHTQVGSSPNGVGQTFHWPGGPIVRMDFIVQNRRDTRPGRIQLFALDDIGQPDDPGRVEVFADDVDLSGAVGLQQRSFFPGDDDRPEGPYFVLFTSATRDNYRIVGSLANGDYHSPGERYYQGSPQGAAGGDLWFRLFTSDPSGSPAPPPIDAFPAPPASLPVPAPVFDIPRSAYADRIAAYQDTIRPLVTGAAAPHKFAARWAAGEALLARAGGYVCDPVKSCAETTAEMLRNAYAYRAQECGAVDPNPSDPGSYSVACDPLITELWFAEPVLAYFWIREDPALSPVDHAEARDLLLDSARRYFNQPQEGGAHNRAASRLLALGGVASLFPTDPQAAEWSDYAACLWDYFWHYRDSYENSGQYEGLFWKGMLAYAEISGRNDPGSPDYLWTDPDFLALVERFYRHTLPLGTLPNYGDNGGFAHHWFSRLYLFELAATHTGDARYKYLADRLWDYSTARICDAPPANDHLIGEHDALALAYLAADESIAAGPPAGAFESPFATHELEGESVAVGAGVPVGQTFLAAQSPLVRIDLRVRNGGSEGDGELRLYRWLGDRASTVAAPPLFHASMELGGNDVWVTKSFRPYLPLEAGASYYVELDRAGAAFAAALPAAGDYADGELLVGGVADPARDLWFAAFALAGEGSSTSTRVKSRLRRFSEQADNPFPARPECDGYPLGNHMLEEIGVGDPIRIADKLVLRSGSDPADLAAVFELLPSGYQHTQGAMGGLTLLTEGESVLLHDAAYDYGSFTSSGTVQPFDESLPHVRRYSGGSIGAQGDEVTVDRFADYREATVASLHFDDPAGWGVEQERHVFFVKNRFLWVRDRFRFPGVLELAVGPIWHAAEIAPALPGLADHAFDVYTHRLLHKSWQIANPHRFARIFLVPRPGYEVSAAHHEGYDPEDPGACVSPPDSCELVSNACRAGPAQVIYQRWSGVASAGEERWFDTLLVPHDGMLPEGAIRTLHDPGDGSVVLEVDVAGETWTLADNPGGATLDTPALHTDADYLLARSAPGLDDYLLVENATSVRVASIDATFPAPVSLESDAAYLAGGDPCVTGPAEACAGIAVPAVGPGALAGWLAALAFACGGIAVRKARASG